MGIENIDIEKLYAQAEHHRLEHKCSAHPYKEGERLAQIVLKYEPNKILEIGTGMGYTAAVMALSRPAARIETLEKDPEHVLAAQNFLTDNHLSERIKVVNEPAEQYMGTLDKQYDLIFFDGFQIHYEFLSHYQRLLKPGGVLVLANNHLTSKTSDHFFEEISNSGNWKIIEQFADTTVAERI